MRVFPRNLASRVSKLRFELVQADKRKPVILGEHTVDIKSLTPNQPVRPLKKFVTFCLMTSCADGELGRTDVRIWAVWQDAHQNQPPRRGVLFSSNYCSRCADVLLFSPRSRRSSSHTGSTSSSRARFRTLMSALCRLWAKPSRSARASHVSFMLSLCFSISFFFSLSLHC